MYRVLPQCLGVVQKWEPAGMGLVWGQLRGRTCAEDEGSRALLRLNSCWV